jgi:hypothetical protein
MPSAVKATAPKAFVLIITVRGRNVGYGVYSKWTSAEGLRLGECLHQYRWVGAARARSCDTWEEALHLANKHRDDFNASHGVPT